ncbi:MAG: archaeosortase/exosortase family protein [Rariglobus sp.]
MSRLLLTSRAVALIALLVAGWPVLRWYALRLGDGSDEPWGLAALALALLFAPWRSWGEPLAPARRAWLCGLLALYCLALPWMPPLARALLLVTMIGIAASVRGFSTAWWGLLVLSLPVVSTLQFYLGYPLRWLTTHLSVPLIALGGHTARAAGTTLHWAGERVIVDAPCSGIQMLWTGLLIATALACWHRLDLRGTFTLVRVAAAVVFVANILRATALFFTETGLWPAPAWSHTGIGLGLFALSALAVLFTAERLAHRALPVA